MAVFTTAFVAGALGVASTSLAASVSAFALNAAVGIGVSMLAKQLQKPSSAGQQTNGVNGTLQAGGDVARSFVMGRRTTAGSLVYANTWGQASKTPNAYFTQVIALSDMPIKTISAFWVNGDPVTVDTSDTSYGDWGYPVVEYNTGNNNHMWIKFYDGTQTVADPFLVNTVSSTDRPYENTRVGTGVAYAIVTSQADDELFSGFPTFRFEVQGAPLYDITKDSTAGGAGAQRWADPSTWGGDGDDLPVVQIYNILRGITYGGDWLYGLQSLTAPRLPSADWIAQVNKCRAAIDGPDGLEATYLTGMEISVDTEISATIESLLTGCQGKLIETGGFYKTRVGEPGAAVYAFSDGDILSTEEQSFTPFFGLADTVNGVSATYPEPAEAWNTKPAPPLYNATFEAQDGNRRLMTSVDLNMVYRSSQVQRIMLSALNEARRARRHTFVLPPQAWVLEPGDIVSFTSNRNGYTAKLFRVDGIADHANLDVTLDLTEVDPSDYDWDQDHDYKPPVFAPLGPVMPPSQPMYGWAVAPATLNNSAGQPWRPSIKISCAQDQTDVSNVWVQVRLAATADIVFDSDSTRYAAPYSWVINATFKPNTNYEARGKFIPFGSRSTEWSAWLPVTTPNVLISSDDIYLDGVVDDLHDFVSDATIWVRDGVRQALLDAQQNTRITADQDFGTFADRQEIRSAIASNFASQYTQITAEYSSAIIVATGPTSALSQRIDTFTASLIDANTQITAQGSAISDISTSITNINGSITSISQDVTTLQSGLTDANTLISGNSTAIDQLITKTDNTNNALTSAAQRITTLETTVNDPANGVFATANALAALTTRVTTSEGNISILSQSLIDVNSSLTSQQGQITANANATSLLQTQVTSINGTVAAQADLINSVSVQVGNISASANFRASVYAAPGGYSARIGLEARGGSAGSYSSASAFLDVPSTAGSPTRFAVVADQFSVTNGSNYQNPFIFQSGVAYLNSIKVNWADIVNASIATAQIQDGAITNAKIGNLTVQTSNLDFNQITDSASNTRTGTTPAGSESVVGATWVINNPNPNPVLTSFFFQFTVQGTPSGGTVRVRLVDDTTGAEIAGLTINVPTSGSSTQSVQGMIIEPRPGAQGNYQYSIRGQAGAQNITATINQLWWKR